MGFDIFGGLNQALFAPQEAQYQRDALAKARQTQQGQYQQNQGRYDPYYQQGTQAMQSLAGNVQNGAYNTNVNAQNIGDDPGFQFRMAQGQKALERSAAAHGGLMSGGFAKGLADYSQGLASNEYQNAWNRNFQQNQFNYNSMANLAGMGERAAGSLAGLGERYGNNMAGYDIAGGNINAAQLAAMGQGAGSFADGSMGMGIAAATGGMGGMGGGGGGGGGYMSAGNPSSMAPLGGGYRDTGWGGTATGSIGAIPTQGGYGSMGGGYPHDPYGNPYGDY